jgi:hypothetical protein
LQIFSSNVAKVRFAGLVLTSCCTGANFNRFSGF